MNLTLQQLLYWIIFISLMVTVNVLSANSDKDMQDKMLRQREVLQNGKHAGHPTKDFNGAEFKGVYYGYLPCQEADCSGIKVTLSLKRENNYLLVTQMAKTASREFYEKGKFIWDEEKRTVVLTPKDKSKGKQFRILDEGALVQLNSDGSALAGDQDDYTLRRGDTMKSREMHIH